MDNEKIYVSERIVNMAGLEDILRRAWILAQQIQKKSPDDESSSLIVDLLKEAVDYEFCIERRKTIYRD